MKYLLTLAFLLTSGCISNGVYERRFDVLFNYHFKLIDCLRVKAVHNDFVESDYIIKKCIVPNIEEYIKEQK